MAIITRADKGLALTHAELDENFTDLRDGVAIQVPKTKNAGIKTDSLGTPTYPWRDITGVLLVSATDNIPAFNVYRGGLKARQFTEQVDEAFVNFHMPHDYVADTPIYIHCHWSSTSALITGGSVTFGFEMTYAKGFDQEAFISPITVTVAQAVSTVQYQHMVAEGVASVEGGGPVLLDTTLLEPDGIILCRVFVDSNDITVSGGGVPEPFIHQIDIHYQSTNVGTKAKAPDFWT